MLAKSAGRTRTVCYNHIFLKDVPTVGGKNASLGQLFNNLRPMGISVPEGFAITAAAYRHLLKQNDLEKRLRSIFTSFDFEAVTELTKRGSQARPETVHSSKSRQTFAAVYILTATPSDRQARISYYF